MRCLVTQQAAKLQSYFCCTTWWLLWVYVDFKSSSRNTWTRTLPWYFRKKYKKYSVLPSYISVWPLTIDPCWSDLALHRHSHFHRASTRAVYLPAVTTLESLRLLVGTRQPLQVNNWLLPQCWGFGQHLETRFFPPCSWDDRKCSQLHSASRDPYMKESKDFIAIMNLYYTEVFIFP